jgi:hypothetical protein
LNRTPECSLWCHRVTQVLYASCPELRCQSIQFSTVQQDMPPQLIHLDVLGRPTPPKNGNQVIHKTHQPRRLNWNISTGTSQLEHLNMDTSASQPRHDLTQQQKPPSLERKHSNKSSPKSSPSYSPATPDTSMQAFVP